MLLEGKKAVVTGGTRGIGFAIVETFLKNGASVALFGSRQETVDKALAKLKAENPDWDVIGMAPDLTDYAAVDAAMAKVTEAFGRIDILVNNAGISAREPLYQYDPAAFKNIMDLNVTAVFNGCRAVAPIMKAQGGGSIINTSSMVSLYGQPSGVGYPTSKFAVNGLNRSLARELGRDNIRVNAVARRNPHRHGRQPAGRNCEARLRADSPPAHGRTAGSRQRVPVPRQRSGQLCHRRDFVG